MPIKLKADKGDVDDQWRLAWAYADGKLGLDKDDQMAFNYFQQMAEEKDCRALWRMAEAYKHGDLCLEVNDAKALEFAELLMDTESGTAPENSFMGTGLSKAQAILLFVADLPGGEPLFKALLADERVDPNIGDEDGDTALMGAAYKGHASVVTLLLADERVDPSIVDEDGGTAITCVSLNRHGSVVKLLLADDAV